MLHSTLFCQEIQREHESPTVEGSLTLTLGAHVRSGVDLNQIFWVLGIHISQTPQLYLNLVPRRHSEAEDL